MKVGAVDIGTNSMRLLITDGQIDECRWVEVTGLGTGVDSTGRLDTEAMDRTLEVFARFGRRMDEAGVERRKAIATSASRDASNREEFFDRAEAALGVRPTLLSGAVEARTAFAGATGWLDDPSTAVVSDIGGGSTEFVSLESESSIDIGTVRLNERALPNRPASRIQLKEASSLVADLFADVHVGEPSPLVGVAGTWTSLAAIASRSQPGVQVHGRTLTVEALETTCGDLADMTVQETAAIPYLDPARAPVMLSGAVIALGVVGALGVDQVVISESDSLDGVAGDLLALR